MNAQTILAQPTNNTLIVEMRVERGLTPMQWLDKIGGCQFTTPEGVASMPLDPNGPTRGKFVWFQCDRRIADVEVEHERSKRGLVRDLEMQLQHHVNHPEFAYSHFNSDSWENWQGAGEDTMCMLDILSWAGVTPHMYVLSHVPSKSDIWYRERWFGGRLIE